MCNKTRRTRWWPIRHIRHLSSEPRTNVSSCLPQPLYIVPVWAVGMTNPIAVIHHGSSRPTIGDDRVERFSPLTSTRLWIPRDCLSDTAGDVWIKLQKLQPQPVLQSNNHLRSFDIKSTPSQNIIGEPQATDNLIKPVRLRSPIIIEWRGRVAVLDALKWATLCCRLLI